eukprot:TRINITY_DN4592_c0_g1_i1.p1 TRINITY_DN4592_c0_g1~~TRINITY_DN4592_c0_g1_i1.p1  ORF type:complete len:770 (+),score=251.09 TRINITY_DN4592_c0_g1_i1:28-2337(+)
MASNDFIENAISSNVDESAVSDLANSLENSISNPGGGPAQGGPGGGQRMIVRTVGPGGQPVPGPGPPQGQRVVMTTQGQQIIRTASGQMVMTSGGQRIVGPGGQVLMARPQGQQIQQGVPGQVLGQQLQQGQQIVRTSTGQILVQQGGMAQQRGQVLQQQQSPVGQTAVIRQQLPQVPQNQAGIQRVVINQPGIRPGQPGSQITVPLSTLQALQAGQGIPTGQPGHLLVKTETGQYQILRVGPPGQGGSTTTATPVSVPQSLTGQPSPSPVRPQLAAASPSPQPRLPTAPIARQQVAQPAAAAAAANSANSMGQQMTPDTAKIKCKNFLATLLRLASDQPESVARNVRALIQGLIDGRVEPEVFTTKLQKELNSSPQPCLVPFLKKSLPYLQHSLATRELTIDGVNPPTINQVGKLPPAMTVSAPIAQSSRPPISLPPMSAPPHSVMGQVRTNLPTHPQPRIGSSLPQARPTFARPGFPSLPTAPLRPGVMGGQYSGGLGQGLQHPLLPPPKGPQAVIRDKKSGNNAYSAAGDDDINDVAAMGGVNLAEEANRILGSTDNVGSVIRSCKDETFLQTGLLHQRITRICREKGLDAPTQEVISLMSHATQDRLKTLVSKLSVIAEHRLDIIKTEGPYEATQDIKGQLRFLEDLDKMEKKRHEEAEREMLLRAAKSRTKTDDPEKEKLKAKAKEIQRDEAERIRHQEANRTALEAIGGPKKRKFGEVDPKMGPSNVPLRARTKRVHLRDVMFLMEQEKDLKHSSLLFKSYCN